MIDHIGWRLWNGAMRWKARFAEEMVAAGHGWYAEARSSIIPFIKLTGTRQTDIAAKMGLTKQAIQQLVDDLEKEGIVERRPDPSDGRAKVVVFTEKGLKAQKDSEVIKSRIHDEIRSEIGSDNFDRLMDILKLVAPDP